MMMRRSGVALKTFCLSLALVTATAAQATYWNLFNIEGESTISAQYITYASLDDMVNDTNRVGSFFPNAGEAGSNIVGTGSNGSTYWNLFNIEGESSISAQYITYASLGDMLIDTNRVGSFFPNAGEAGSNIVGTGSNGSTYWNLFNIEGESSVSAQYITYASLVDMLNDTNRVGSFFPNGGEAGSNIVGTGSNGSTYWNLFNIEGESSISAQYITYASLNDMLNDSNRVGSFFPNAGEAGFNIVGSGSDSFATSAVPEPSSWAKMTVGFSILGGALRSRKAAPRSRRLIGR